MSTLSTLYGVLDPIPARPVRVAFLAEALFHVVTIPLITRPYGYLSFFMVRPADITLATQFFARVFAGLILFGMSPLLLYGVPNTKRAIGSRRATYIMLAGTEIYLIPLLLIELSKGGQHDHGAALTVVATIGLMSLLVLPFAFRMYALFVKPVMMGDLEDSKRRD